MQNQILEYSKKAYLRFRNLLWVVFDTTKTKTTLFEQFPKVFEWIWTFPDIRICIILHILSTNPFKVAVSGFLKLYNFWFVDYWHFDERKQLLYQHKRSETLPSCFCQLTNCFYKFWTVLWLFLTDIPFTLVHKTVNVASSDQSEPSSFLEQISNKNLSIFHVPGSKRL